MTAQYERLTDSQWEVIKEYLPIKRKRQLDLREVFNAILWITRTGAQWRNLDSSFPAWTAVYYYFYRWTRRGLIEKINRALERVWEFYSLNTRYFDKIIEQLAKYRNDTELSMVCS